MSIEVKWLIESQVIYVKYDDHIRVEDFVQAGQSIELMLEGKQQSIHILHDHRNTRSVPLDVSKIIKAVRPALERSNNGYQITFSGLEPTLAMSAKWVTGVLKSPYRHFKTKEQALTFLSSFVSDLPDPDRENQ